MNGTLKKVSWFLAAAAAAGFLAMSTLSPAHAAGLGASGGGAIKAGQVPGVASNTAACAGCVGEVISSSQIGISYGGSSLSDQNVTSVSLTAGDWICSGSIFVSSTTSVSSFAGWISTTSATFPGYTAQSVFSLSYTVATATSIVNNTSDYHLLVNATTTVYLSIELGFGGTANKGGTITCHRIR